MTKRHYRLRCGQSSTLPVAVCSTRYACRQRKVQPETATAGWKLQWQIHSAREDRGYLGHCRDYCRGERLMNLHRGMRTALQHQRQRASTIVGANICARLQTMSGTDAMPIPGRRRSLRLDSTRVWTSPARPRLPRRGLDCRTRGNATGRGKRPQVYPASSKAAPASSA